MSQHKYNPRQMLFVKNVPQDSAMCIAALFLPYKPLETRNLYPDSRITTFIVVLPDEAETEEALCHTDGLRLGSTVISVERYNAKQSTVARRDARKKRNVQEEYDQGGGYEGCDEYEEYNVDEEAQEEMGLSIADEVAAQAVDMRAVETRTVRKDGNVSWANIASGMVAELHSPSLGPVNGKPPLAWVNQDTWNSRPTHNGIGASTHHAPLTKDMPTSPVANPIKPPPGFEHNVPKIVRTPATASLGPRPDVPLLPTSAPPDTRFYTTRGNLIPAEATRAESSDGPRVEVGSSQQTQVPDWVQQQRGSLGMPTNSSQILHVHHCRKCSICQLMMNRQQYE